MIREWSIHTVQKIGTAANAARYSTAATRLAPILAVPDLEPVPVGRISTALRATRSGFQEGLRDDAGDEIPFDSVDQIRELCRRGFLGGGLGPGAPGVGPIPYPAPADGPGGAMLAELEDVLEGLQTWEPRTLREVLGHLHPRAIERLVAYSQELMDLALETWGTVERSADSHETYDRLREARIRLWSWLVSNALIDYAPIAVELLGSPHGSPWFQVYDELEGRWIFVPRGTPAEPRPNDASLTPLSVPYQRYPIRRLGEIAILASITEDFAQDKQRLEHVATTATWHMIRLAGRRYPVAVNTERLMQDALREVARNAPPVRLPSAASRVLDRWIRGLLDPRPHGKLATL
jgi:hypothetical protein